MTGVTGQSGSYLAELLLEKGQEVHGIKRRASSFNTSRVDHIYEDPHVTYASFRLHHGDLTDRSNLTAVNSDMAPAVKSGDVIIRIDPRYFRPAEVDTLLGAPTKAKERLGWTPKITAQEVCAEMVAEDLKASRRTALLKEHGLELPVALEG